MTADKPSETPSQYLIRAAQHVYRLGRHFTEHYVNRPLDPMDTKTDEETWVGDTVAPDASAQARRWVGTMSPRLMVALACLFQEKAHDVRDATAFTDKGLGEVAVFELAALVLRGVPDPVEKPGLTEYPSWMPPATPAEKGSTK